MYCRGASALSVHTSVVVLAAVGPPVQLPSAVVRKSVFQ